MSFRGEERKGFYNRLRVESLYYCHNSSLMFFRDKAGMSRLTTLLSIIPQILENAIKTRNLYKFIPTGMEEVKLSLFVDNIILLLENPKDSTKKPYQN